MFNYRAQAATFPGFTAAPAKPQPNLFPVNYRKTYRSFLGNIPLADAATDTVSAPWYQTLLSQAGNIATSVQSVKQSQNVAKINAQRLAAGQPPLTAEEMASLNPSAGVSVGLSPDVQRIAIGLGIGAGLLGLLWILTRGKK